MVQWNWLGLKPVFERGGRREEIFEREEERGDWDESVIGLYFWTSTSCWGLGKL